MDGAVLHAVTPADVAARLASHPVTDPVRFPGVRRAAVAVVLRFDRGRPEVLLMNRAEREGDRWSGHVSFPGGGEHEADPDLCATARRETLEELGVDLAAARLLGRLESIRAVAKGKVLPMTISPFVFERSGDVDFRLNHEAVGAFWLPLDLAASGALDDRYPYKLGPLPMDLPCWRYDGHVVWGLTYQMLRKLLEQLLR
jgi:8-oxo-dGTP pyrophosphatase MutT (NUDIX family)